MSKYQDALDNVRKFEREHNMSKFGDVVPQPNSDTLQELVDKETKYQNLEEELGIDLITLFKALTEVNGIWYKDCEKIIKVVVLSISTMRENKFCLECYYDFKRFRVDTKDFNKTWWLEKPKGGNDEHD